MLLRHADSRIHTGFAVAALLASLAAAPGAAASAPIFDEVHTIAAPTVGVPQEFTFSVTTPGTYTVTLTDLGKQLTPSAPLATVKMAVSSADALVGSPLVGEGTLTLTSIPAGNYEIHVIGTPGTGPGSGSFGILVEDSSHTQIAAFGGVLALPSGALPSGEAVLNDSFVPQNGSGSPCVPPQADLCYTVSLNDLQLPQSLPTLTLLLIAQGGTTPVLTLSSAGQTTVSLTAGVPYTILAAALASGPVNAGLFSVVITPGAGGSPLYGRAVPVGNTLLLGSPALGAGTATLNLTDLKYPATLSQLGAVVTLDGVVQATVTGAGPQNFAAVAQTYAAFGVGIAAAGSAGSYAAQITGVPGTFSVARGVTDTASPLSAYAFDITIGSAGPYTATLTDFQFPAALSSVSLAAAQNLALHGTPIAGAGALSIPSAASGPLSLLVFAQPGSGTAGLFGIDLTPAPSGSAVFDITQAVGAVFVSQTLAITSAGTYRVTANDLGFPASFANYDTIVTQGATQLGLIIGGGPFKFAATPGNYFINFIAQPSGADQAGTYALTVDAVPPPPVVTLSVDHPQVSSGAMVDLIWTTQNATSCTSTPASGEWGGSVPLSGTLTSAALTGNTTFTLTCTGPGGPTMQSVMVTVTAGSSGGGGGGSLDPPLLLLLAALALGGRRRFAPVMDASRRLAKFAGSHH
jgi:hypothetical protein